MSKKILNSIKSFVVFSLILSLISFTYFLNNRLEQPKGPEVKSEDINVSALIYGCVLNLNVKPAGRVPATNNWQTSITVEVFDGTNSMGSFSTTTNNMGDATVDLCAQNIYLQSGTYDFYIKGLSHLKRKFENVNGFGITVNSVDFTPIGGELVPGETSVVYDNYINVLDISTQLRKLGLADNLNDLNQDGIVNSDDIDISIINLYQKGDCAPNESISGVCN